MLRSTSTKRRPGLGLEPGDQADGRPDLRVAVAAQLRQPLDVAPGQQVHRLGADAQRRGSTLACASPSACMRLQLQRQALGQRTGAHARRVQVCSKSQRDGEAVHQFFLLLDVVARQAGGERLQRLLQVAVVVERFDQEAQRGPVFLGQAQRKRLPVQVGLQRLAAARQVGRVDVFVVAQVVLARRRIAAPLAVVGHDFGAAVAVPAGRLGFAGVGALGLGFRSQAIAARRSRRRTRSRGRPRGTGASACGQPELLRGASSAAQLRGRGCRRASARLPAPARAWTAAAAGSTAAAAASAQDAGRREAIAPASSGILQRQAASTFGSVRRDTPGARRRCSRSRRACPAPARGRR